MLRMRLPRLGRPLEDVPDPFERALLREILVSEQRRVTILAALMGGMCVTWLASGLLVPAQVPLMEQLGLAQRRAVVVVLTGAAFIYELIVRTGIGHFIRTGRHPPAVARYVNCVVETSLPALVIIATADIGDPAYALLLPPTSFFFIFILLSTLRLDFKLCLFTGLVAAAEYTALAAWTLPQARTAAPDPLLTSWVPHGLKAAIFLLSGLLAGLVSLQIKRQFVNSFRSVEERNRVVDMFGQHVSPAVVDRLLTQEVALGGEVRHVCVMFLDIRGFTAFSEQRSPPEVVEYLNTLFGPMIESVNRHAGIVNKFLGDGFMAVFGAPISDGADCRHAVAAAIEMVERAEALSAAGRIPPTRIGIGLHAGDVVTGNVGSTVRKEYTIIGAVVNLASRIEQLNKQFGSCLLVSEAVCEAIRGDGLEPIPLGPVAVRGYEAPVPIYRLA
jgi:adenylate cyclase